MHVGRGFSGTQIYEQVCAQQRAAGGLWEDPEVLHYYLYSIATHNRTYNVYGCSYSYTRTLDTCGAQFPADFDSIGMHDIQHSDVVWKRPKVCSRTHALSWSQCTMSEAVQFH